MLILLFSGVHNALRWTLYVVTMSVYITSSRPQLGRHCITVVGWTRRSLIINNNNNTDICKGCGEIVETIKYNIRIYYKRPGDDEEKRVFFHERSSTILRLEKKKRKKRRDSKIEWVTGMGELYCWIGLLNLKTMHHCFRKYKCEHKRLRGSVYNVYMFIKKQNDNFSNRNPYTKDKALILILFKFLISIKIIRTVEIYTFSRE